MKSINRSFLFALLVATAGAPGCGGDNASRGVDPMSFLPKLPAAQEPSVVTPAQEPVKAEPVVRVMPTKYDDALAQGRELAAKGDPKGAIEMFEAAIKLDKKHADPHIELARIYIASNERGLAIAAANKGVKLAPLSSLAWNTKGRAELNRFDYDAAIEAFSKAVELNRDNVWAWNNLGYAELQLKKYDEAVEHLTEATSRAGATGFMFNNLGTALEQLDRLDEARTAFEAGSKLGSKESVASRKRLEGVKTIAIAKKDEPKADMTKGKTFDTSEGKPDEMTGSGSAPKDVEPTTDVTNPEPKDEPKTEEPKVEPKVEAKPEIKAELDDSTSTDDDVATGDDDDAGVPASSM
jgi:Flp pilus assembly protein TadD